MRKRILLKFLEAYVLIGFLGFLLITLAGSHMIEALLEQEISESLYQDAYNVAENDSVKNNISSSNLSKIQANLYMISDYPSTLIWIINSDGKIIVSTRTDISADQPIEIKDFDPSDWGSNYYQVGDFYGYFPESYLSVIAPITDNMTTKGYVAIHYLMSDLYQKRGELLFVIQILFLAVYLMAALLILIYRHYVHKPLKEITRGAAEFANGNLAYKIPVTSENEIGYLANSLNYMAEKLNRSGEYQRQFISNISHDFRSPLTSIKGYVDAMLDGVIPPDSQEKYLKIIAYESGRLEKLTEGLLTLNELDIHKRLLKIQTFDINEVIKNTAATYEGDCTKRKILLELLLSGKELYAKADVEQIQQVLHNLLNNAIKFSPDHSTIVIETSEKNDKIFVSVKDHGIGIPKQSLHRIWERFYKTDISRGKDQTGTGLGLSIVKEIISAHGENINVISTEGVGTKFIFTLEKAR
ncbi:MAG TPA: HAMP domain-containing histidine kinase [Candidatus Blautia faecipullorum]|nr:HAMP domain-containing histidine kinase [Candidatus Blautia faecipullorum]